jgi:hypothetical protein
LGQWRRTFRSNAVFMVGRQAQSGLVTHTGRMHQRS